MRPFTQTCCMVTIRLTIGLDWLDHDRPITVPRQDLGAGTLLRKGGGPMRSSTWIGLGVSGVLLLGMAMRSAASEGGNKAEPVLEIMSLDRGEFSLGVSWPWGAMAANRVMFNDHRGPFKAVVESSDKGVRVSFEGWGEGPF